MSAVVESAAGDSETRASAAPELIAWQSAAESIIGTSRGVSVCVRTIASCGANAVSVAAMESTAIVSKLSESIVGVVEPIESYLVEPLAKSASIGAT